MKRSDLLALLPRFEEVRQRVRDFEDGLQHDHGIRLQVPLLDVDTQHLIDAVARLVGDVLRITMSQMLAQGRVVQNVEARQIAMWLCLKHIPGTSLAEVGRYFGKDHSTVIHARDHVDNLLASRDKAVTAKINACTEALQQRTTQEPDTAL